MNSLTPMFFACLWSVVVAEGDSSSLRYSTQSTLNVPNIQAAYVAGGRLITRIGAPSDPDGYIEIRDLENTQTAVKITGRTDLLRISTGSAPSIVYGTSSNGVLWSLQVSDISGELLFELPNSYFTISPSPNGRYFASDCRGEECGGNVFVFDRSGRIIYEGDRWQYGNWSVAWIGDTRLLIADIYQYVVVDLPSGKVAAEGEFKLNCLAPPSIVGSSAGHEGAIFVRCLDNAGSIVDSMLIINDSTGIAWSAQLPGYYEEASFSTVGTRIAVALSKDGLRLTTFDIDSREMSEPLTLSPKSGTESGEPVEVQFIDSWITVFVSPEANPVLSQNVSVSHTYVISCGQDWKLLTSQIALGRLIMATGTSAVHWPIPGNAMLSIGVIEQ